MFNRYIALEIEKVLSNPTDHRVAIVVGQRRVGKTVLLGHFKQKFSQSVYFDLEALDTQRIFVPELLSLQSLFARLNPTGGPFLLILDELQNLEKSGTVLKLIHDHFPKIKVLASGSSSYLLMENIGDSLYGRKIVFELFPLTVGETLGVPVEEVRINSLVFDYANPILVSKFQESLADWLVYGSLPEVASTFSWETKQALLSDYVKSLLFKDIFTFEGIKSPEVFKKLLVLLSLQIGNLVNPSELAQALGVSRNTILEYIAIYERFYLLFKLLPFATNERDEVHTKFKVFFYDLGLRNVLASNFSPLSIRPDAGALFENFVVRSLKVNMAYFSPHLKAYFWRNHDGFEVDLVIKDINSGKLYPLEIKRHRQRLPSKAFRNRYVSQVGKEFAIFGGNALQFVV